MNKEKGIGELVSFRAVVKEGSINVRIGESEATFLDPVLAEKRLHFGAAEVAIGRSLHTAPPIKPVGHVFVRRLK